MLRTMVLRQIRVLAVAAALVAVWAAPASAASSDSGYNYYYTWGSNPDEIFCARGQSFWSDAQTPATSPLSGMTAQEVSLAHLYCPDLYGMGAGYQYAEGTMLKWNGSSW